MALSASPSVSTVFGLSVFLLLTGHTDAATCSSCDGNVSGFLTDLSNRDVFGYDSAEFGNATCFSAEELLQCYYGCTFENGTATVGLRYLYSAGISKEAFTLNEWWKVNCDVGCRMADALVCEHMTYETARQCEDIGSWRSCVETALAPYSCDGFCQISDRWHKAYKLHHEIDCAPASRECLTELKSCLHDKLAYSSSPDEDLTYLLSWEFFYNSGIPRDFRCETINSADVCFTNNTCQEEDDISRIRSMIDNASGLFCSNSTEDVEAACQVIDYTSTPSTSSSTTSSTTSSTSSTSSTTSTPRLTTTDSLPLPGSCRLCDEYTQTILMIASLHQHPNNNRTEFGSMVCSNYTEALECYNNCTHRGINTTLWQYVSPELETLHTQQILSCDSTCRHSDMWICENYFTTENTCLEGEYERWLACYEEGKAQYNCDKACSVAQRRVNSYKVGRQITCGIQKMGNNSLCAEAVNECINVRYSRTYMNFENFLTTDPSSPLACSYFVNGSDCLSGLIPVNFNDTRTIFDFCETQEEKDIVAELNASWRDIYHHDECAALPDGSSQTYSDFCMPEQLSTTTPSAHFTAEIGENGAEGQCVNYKEDTAANPCRRLDPLRCEERDEWLQCSSSHAAANGCNGMCTEIERSNAIETLVSSIHCNLPAGGESLCSDTVKWNCLTNIWVESQDFTFQDFIHPEGSLQDWCGKFEEMRNCFYESAYGEVPYFTTVITQPCIEKEDYIQSLIEMADNISSLVCPAASWQDACPGSLLGLDDDNDSADNDEQDECPIDIRALENCPSDNIFLCDDHFTNWTRCLENEGIFTDCESLCTKKRRAAFASYLEMFITCNVDEQATDFCWEYIANECLLDLFGDRRFATLTNMKHNETVAPLCELLDNFTTCLDVSMTEEVTVVALATTKFAPCAAQQGLIDATKQRVSEAISNGICEDRSKTFSEFCPKHHGTHSVPSNTTASPTASATQEPKTTSTLDEYTSTASTLLPDESTTHTYTVTPVFFTNPPKTGAYKVTARISLDADYDSVVGSNTEAAKFEIKPQLANFLDAPVDAITINSISPGSIKIDFEMQTDDEALATSSSASISAGLPSITVNGQSFETTTELVELDVVSPTPFVPTTHTPYFECDDCVKHLTSIVKYETNNGTFSSADYSAAVCRELDIIADECFANCVDSRGFEMSVDDPKYSQALEIRSLWCGEDCPFARTASCYTGASPCSVEKISNLDSCLMAESSDNCEGLCRPSQRYRLAEKVNRYLSCFPTDDLECSNHVKTCFDSFMTNSLISFSEMVGGNALSPRKSLADVCRFMRGPKDCLMAIDFTQVCQSHEPQVTRMVQEWSSEYEDEVCQEDQGSMSFGEKCRQERNSPRDPKPPSTNKPTENTTDKPQKGKAGQSQSGNRANHLSANFSFAVYAILLIKLFQSHLL
ncbi:uncharacterized protein [Watersipora subatra]|uniref:uncharacterized protein n=1 Tax=Watersipora subatra TaxID=2589382 RepID=UPI00355AEDD0